MSSLLMFTVLTFFLQFWPLLADVFLYSYEADFIQSLLSTGKKQLASRFNLTYRYIDDVLSINKPEFEIYLGQMYSAELEIMDTTESTTSASYLDLLLSIGRDGQLHTSIYDKRDDFNFHITIFSFLCSNIPSSPAYGVFISQPIRYARACSSYECFNLRARQLSSKLLKHGYLQERLKSSFRKFYGRYGDLIQQYEVSLSRMLNDTLSLDQQWLLNQSDFPPILWPWYRTWPLSNYEWLSWSICNGCGIPAGKAYPSGHMVPSPFLGLACVPIVETRFLELAMSLLDFSPRISLGTLSILLLTNFCHFLCFWLLQENEYSVLTCPDGFFIYMSIKRLTRKTCQLKI